MSFLSEHLKGYGIEHIDSVRLLEWLKRGSIMCGEAMYYCDQTKLIELQKDTEEIFQELKRRLEVSSRPRASYEYETI